MLFAENIQLAVSSLKANKMRAFLTMLGIIIGISAVIAIFTVGNSLTLSVSNNMQSAGANDIYVNVLPRTEDSGGEDKNADVDGIRFGSRQRLSQMQEGDYINNDMVTGLADFLGDRIKAIGVYSEMEQSQLTSPGARQALSTGLIGVNAGYFLNHPSTIVAGRMFTEADFRSKRPVVLLEEEGAKQLFSEDLSRAVNQEVSMTLDGKEYPLTVVGVYRSDSNNSGFARLGGSRILLPIGSYNNLKGQPQGRYQVIQVIASSDQGDRQSELTSAIDNYFRPYYRNNLNYQAKAITYGGLLNMLMTMLGTITTAISIIAGIALLVGGIGVMNIMLVSVTERTREIGTRKALGAKNASIRTQFIVEAMIICLIGGIIGVVLGIILGVGASNLLGYPARPSISGILIALLFSMGIGIFFGYFPANQAAKMNPIDALRYE